MLWDSLMNGVLCRDGGQGTLNHVREEPSLRQILQPQSCEWMTQGTQMNYSVESFQDSRPIWSLAKSNEHLKQWWLVTRKWLTEPASQIIYVPEDPLHLILSLKEIKMDSFSGLPVKLSSGDRLEWRSWESVYVEGGLGVSSNSALHCIPGCPLLFWGHSSSWGLSLEHFPSALRLCSSPFPAHQD